MLVRCGLSGNKENLVLDIRGSSGEVQVVVLSLDHD
jgi:hypothetical protein